MHGLRNPYIPPPSTLLTHLIGSALISANANTLERIFVSQTITAKTLDPALTAAIEKAVEAAVGRALAKAPGQPRTVDDLLTTKETCARLRISDATLYTWMRDGKLTSRRVGNRNLFDPRDIDRLIDGGTA